MIIGPPGAAVRLQLDEWKVIQHTYPSVAFNHRENEQDKRHLVVCEPFTCLPGQWSIELAKQYDTYITFNRKIYEQFKGVTNCRYMNGVPAFNSYYWPDSHVKYEDKIRAIVIQNKLYGMGSLGSIIHYRQRFVDCMSKFYDVHVWSPTRWGGGHYKGDVCSPLHHSHITQLNKTAEYLFSFCPESTYHPMWSLGFITERLFNCFKAKTIAIYIGCWDVEKYVPKDLFIDFRPFYPNDFVGLSKLLKSYTKSQYEDTVEKAFEWQRTNRIGSIQDLECILKEVI